MKTRSEVFQFEKELKWRIQSVIDEINKADVVVAKRSAHAKASSPLTASLPSNAASTSPANL